MATTSVHIDPTTDDRIPYLTVTVGDDADGTGTATIQAYDHAGNELAEVVRIRTWLDAAGAEFGPPTAATDFSVSTGTELQEIVANADYDVISDASGEVVMDISDAGAHWVMADLDGRIYTGTNTITGP